MDVPILGGPFNGGSIEVPRRTTAGLKLSLQVGDVSAEYRFASIDGRVTAVPVELVDDTPPYALRSVIDERLDLALRSAADRSDERAADERARARDFI